MREKEILDNIGLVYSAIKNMNFQQRNDDEEWDEILNSGIIGLIQGIDTYKKEKGKKSTYYYKCIINEIRNIYIVRTAQKRNFIAYSLDYCLSDTNTEYINLIPNNQNIEKDYIKNEELQFMLNKLENYKNKKHRDMIKENYGIGCERKKMTEIARKYNMSKQNAYETKKRVFQKIRKEMENDYY